MFTGIISHIGTVSELHKDGDWVITIAAQNFTQQMVLGASVACSGTCLTVIAKTEDDFTVQAASETLARTTVSSWKVGSTINLERALKMGDELGGHLVSGHVDGLAVLTAKSATNAAWKLDFIAPTILSRFIAEKGSVTLDGVSLTVNAVKGDVFSVTVIPHTLTATTLGARYVGDRVNLEIDLIARYLARMQEKD